MGNGNTIPVIARVKWIREFSKIGEEAVPGIFSARNLESIQKQGKEAFFNILRKGKALPYAEMSGKDRARLIRQGAQKPLLVGHSSMHFHDIVSTLRLRRVGRDPHAKIDDMRFGNNNELIAEFKRVFTYGEVLIIRHSMLPRTYVHNEEHKSKIVSMLQGNRKLLGKEDLIGAYGMAKSMYLSAIMNKLKETIATKINIEIKKRNESIDSEQDKIKLVQPERALLERDSLFDSESKNELFCPEIEDHIIARVNYSPQIQQQLMKSYSLFKSALHPGKVVDEKKMKLFRPEQTKLSRMLLEEST